MNLRASYPQGVRETTTEQRATKEAQSVAASNAKNAPQHAKEQGWVSAIADMQKRLEKALAPHREKQAERDRGMDFGR